MNYIEYLTVFTIITPAAAIAGNTASHLIIPGVAGIAVSKHLPTLSINIPRIEPFDIPTIPICPVPRPVVATTQPPAPRAPNASEVSARNLRTYYTNFGALVGRPSDDQVEDFVTHTVNILLRFPEHNVTARGYWRGEPRLAYKIIFATVFYIGDGSSEVREWLSNEGFTQSELAELDQMRQPTAPGVSHFVGVADQPVGQQNAMRNIVARFQGRF